MHMTVGIGRIKAAAVPVSNKMWERKCQNHLLLAQCLECRLFVKTILRIPSPSFHYTIRPQVLGKRIKFALVDSLFLFKQDGTYGKHYES